MSDATHDVRPVDREHLDLRLEIIQEQIKASAAGVRADIAGLHTAVAEVEKRVGHQILTLFVAMTASLCGAIIAVAFIVQ